MSASIIIDILGTQITPEEIEFIRHPNTAGVILFERNLNGFNRHHLCELTQQIHAVRPDAIIMTDHEGGFIQRFKRMGFRPLISAGSHGRNYSINPEFALKIAYQEGQTMAADLLSCGIDLSLAPVLDIHHSECSIIGGLDRAFHTDPDVIALLAKHYIQGMHDSGMPSVGKHFPGHGSCTGDSHLTRPINNKTWEELEKTDLKPFKLLIQENLLDAVMPAHVLYPEVDSTHVTTYSSRWLKDILRDSLKFEGLVISDCLGMTGADIGDLIERAHQARKGCDLIIAANQTRYTLKQLLDALTTESKNPRLETFRKKIKPNTPRIDQEKNQWIHINPDTSSNIANPTTTI